MKQERSARAQKRADAKAAKIIADAKAAAQAKAAIPPLERYASERKEGSTDEEYAAGVRCRELREEGEPWWSIARAMELEGAGDSATTGKKGAARARTVYARAFGSHPRTFTTGRSTAEKNTAVRELQKAKKAERKAQAKAGKSVISAEMEDAEVAAMLKGRRIRWWIQSEIVPDGMEQEVAIHPTAPLYIIGEGEERVVEFREHHRRAPADIRWMPGPQRTVRLRQIFSVR